MREVARRRVRTRHSRTYDDATPAGRGVASRRRVPDIITYFAVPVLRWTPDVCSLIVVLWHLHATCGRPPPARWHEPRRPQEPALRWGEPRWSDLLRLPATCGSAGRRLPGDALGRHSDTRRLDAPRAAPSMPALTLRPSCCGPAADRIGRGTRLRCDRVHHSHPFFVPRPGEMRTTTACRPSCSRL